MLKEIIEEVKDQNEWAPLENGVKGFNLDTVNKDAKKEKVKKEKKVPTTVAKSVKSK